MEARIKRQVQARLEELYRHHLEPGPDETVRYYHPDVGYVSAASAVRDRGVDPDAFGICLVSADGEMVEAGDSRVPFALQSLSKIVPYAIALDDHGPEQVLQRVGVKPSADSFASLDFDERGNRPYNPMVNAGALVTTALVHGADDRERFERILAVVRGLAGNPDLALDEDVFAAESRSPDWNRAAAYLMRSNGMLTGDVEETLALYLRHCSITMTCRDLAVMAASLANGSVNPLTGQRVLSRRRVRDVLSVMLTCGMYDFAGEWAYAVGLPAKSGVSGGILAVVPGKLGIGVYSPGLDAYGNSVRGTRVCREISERLGLHVLASESEDALLGSGRPEE